MKTEDRNRKNAWKAQQCQEAQSAFLFSNALLESLFESVESRVESDGVITPTVSQESGCLTISC